MSPHQIKELLDTVLKGQPEALRIVDFAFERVICDGSPAEVEEAVQIIGRFLIDASL
jgi:hypothetical protein